MDQYSENRFVKFMISIKTKLLVSFLIVTIVPLIYISYVMLKNATDGLFLVIMRNSMGNARKTSIDLNRFINNQLDDMSILIDSDVNSEHLTLDEKRLSEIDKRNISIEKIYVLGNNGELLLNSTKNPPQYPINFELCMKKFKHQKFVFQTHINSNGRKIVTISTPLKNHSDVIRNILVMELNWMRLTSLLSENIQGKTTRMYLLDRSNKTITSFPEKTIDTDLTIIKSRIESYKYGVYSVSG